MRWRLTSPVLFSPTVLTIVSEMPARFGRLLRDALRVIFPDYCITCGRILNAEEHWICTPCYLELPFTHLRGRSGNVVERLFWGLLPVERANAFLHYDPSSDSKEVFFKLKYHNRPQVGRFFGRVMARDLEATDFFRGIDFIVPLPLHAKKRRLRGYNQSEELARGVSAVTGLPVEADIVERVVNNPSQTHLTPHERRDNVRDIFRLRAPERIAGRHILLIDDVITTNATVVACGRALMQAPGVRISILALGLAGRHPQTVENYDDWHKADLSGWREG